MVCLYPLWDVDYRDEIRIDGWGILRQLIEACFVTVGIPAPAVQAADQSTAA
jgi:hypothetical protein